MKTIIGKSKISGRGVFALENLVKGDVIEVCEVLFLNKRDIKIIDETTLYNYYFSWKGGGAIALGDGSLYNHSYDANAQYIPDFSRNKLMFTAVENISKGEEITVNYNSGPKDKKKVWFDKE